MVTFRDPVSVINTSLARLVLLPRSSPASLLVLSCLLPGSSCCGVKMPFPSRPAGGARCGLWDRHSVHVRRPSWSREGHRS